MRSLQSKDFFFGTYFNFALAVLGNVNLHNEKRCPLFGQTTRHRLLLYLHETFHANNDTDLEPKQFWPHEVGKNGILKGAAVNRRARHYCLENRRFEITFIVLFT